MKTLLIPFFFAIIFLEGCGGGGDSKNPSPDPILSSLSSASSSLLKSSAASSSSLSSSSKASLSSQLSSTTITSSSSSTASSIAFTLTSNSFVPDGNIPSKYSCLSSQVSPQLKWEISSDSVKSFALIMEDMDAVAIVNHPYVHWNVYNIPGSAREIIEGATLSAMPLGSIEGKNDDEVYKYSGPCPPTGTGTHHYYFALYALNTDTLAVNSNHSIERSDFEARYADNIIAKVEIIGLFTP